MHVGVTCLVCAPDLVLSQKRRRYTEYASKLLAPCLSLTGKTLLSQNPHQ